MDGPTLQGKVYGGYAKSALRVGLPYAIYRPTAAASPLAGGNLIATIDAAFTVHSSGNFNFSKPRDYEKPTFHALLDGTQTEVGDFLVGASAPSPFFIAAMDPLVPILAVLCNRVISVATPGPSGFSPGYTPGAYAGTVGAPSATNEVPFLTGWPASILQGARSVADKMLPGDVGRGMWTILLSAYPDVSVSSGDIIADDLGNRYVVRTAELSSLGWRLAAQQAQT